MLRNLILRNRSYRRFYQEKTIPLEFLSELVELARLSPSAANLQPLKFILSSDPKTNEQMFGSLAWAGYLTDWPGPAPGERPAAYIIILWDQRICKKLDCDHGIAAQSILLGAAEKQIGGCIIGSIERDKLQKLFKLPEYMKIMLVLALGYPKEKIQIESVDKKNNVKYWRDETQVHHVPKRNLDDLILKKY